jgi:hypothetical protein
MSFLRFCASFLAMLGAAYASCPCKYQSQPCDFYKLYSNIFVGKVESFSPLNDGQSVSFEVLENLKGEVPQHVTVAAEGKGDCGNGLLTDPNLSKELVGGTVVVFASAQDGTYVVHPCSPVYPAAGYEPMSAQLRAMRGKEITTGIVGGVFRYEISPAVPKAGSAKTMAEYEAWMPKTAALSDIEVRATTGNITLTTRTDADGHFEWPTAPAGDYKVVAVLDDRYVGNKETVVRVPSGSCASTAFMAAWNGKVLGRVTLAGEPLDTYSIWLLPADTRDRTNAPSGHTLADGTFKFEMVQPGDYYLQIGDSPKKGSREIAPVFYPSATTRETASMITVGGGETVGPLEFAIVTPH